jgi:hypothetical protein
VAASFNRAGGARIGWINASWPLAELSVTPRSLVIRVWPLGTYTFTPEQIVRVEPYGSIPVIYRGIRVVHTRPDYRSGIIFWCVRNPARLIERIRQAGFVPAAPPPTAPVKRGIPFRWSFIIALFVVWNALFILGGFLPGTPPPEKPGAFVLLALAVLLFASLATERSPAFQRWVLKPGRSVGEIRPARRLIQLVSAFVLVICAIVFTIA